jgi:LPXTG-motif cell wall-anchored protein
MTFPALRLGLLALLLATLLPATPAFAHTELTGSTPADRAKIKAPTSVELDFSEPVKGSLVQVQVRDAKGVQRQDGVALTVGGKVTQKVKPNLPAGPYSILYRVVSTDGHPVEGTLTFTVIKPTEVADPVPSPTAAAKPVEVNTTRWLVVLGIPFAVLALGGGFLYFRRRNA